MCYEGGRKCVYPDVDIIHPCMLLIQQMFEDFPHAQVHAWLGLELGLPREECNEGLEHRKAGQ